MNRRPLILAGTLLALAVCARAASAAPAPAQANGPMEVTALAGKYKGAGLTIGVIAGSFDSQGFDSLGTLFPSAADDVASGNLPGPGNPNGDTAPVVVFSEPNLKGERDLGRVMMQVIYGIAPKAKLCFASSDVDSYADAIASLTGATGPCRANIIVAGEEAFSQGDGAFSEGAVSAAIEEAVAAGVTFVVAAGDQGPATYDGVFKAVSDSDARAGTFGNLKLSQVPAELTAGGFHDFSTSGAPQLSFSMSTPAHAFSEWELDWDDPSDAAKITAEYKFLVFDKDGNYLANLSGTNHKQGAGPNGEIANVGATDQQLAISLAAPATSATARRLRITSVFQLGGDATLIGLPAQPFAPSLVGHAAAASAISVSSHSKDDPATPEAYNSCGPFTNAFDFSGNRLATAETRQKPDVAGIDGLDATLFPGSVPQPSNDTDHDGFSNVPGSAMSAAAVAAVAALTIEAAGGAATPSQVAGWLRQAASHPSTWAPCDGYGLVDARSATTLASGHSLTADADAGTSVGTPDAGTLPTVPMMTASGCATAGSTGALWLLAACLLLAFARRARQV